MTVREIRKPTPMECAAAMHAVGYAYDAIASLLEGKPSMDDLANFFYHYRLLELELMDSDSNTVFERGDDLDFRGEVKWLEPRGSEG